MEVAVVGIALRYPRASDTATFWEILESGTEVFSTRPQLSPKPRAGTHYVPTRGVLEDTELFDADFFGYAPNEAVVVDPQQRCFLEAAWEVLERAGYDPARCRERIGSMPVKERARSGGGA